MAFTSNLRGSPIIGDENFQKYVDLIENPRTPFSGGYQERDYMLHGLSRPYSGPRIPRSDWEAIIQEKEERGLTMTDLHEKAKIPVLDQNGLPYCVTEDTDILTKSRGFIPWTEYDGYDQLGTINPITGALEFQTPSCRQVFNYKGPIVGSTNKRCNFAVTPQHRMYVRKWDENIRRLSSSYSFVEAKDMGWYSGLMHAPNDWRGIGLVEIEVEGDRTYDADVFIAMLSKVISCGFAGGSEKTKNWVSFCCFNDADYENCKYIASRCGFHEKPSERGMFVRYGAKDLAAWIRDNCYTDPTNPSATNKKIPQIIQELSRRQIKHFLMNFGDQDRKNPMTRFDTSSYQLVTDLQQLLMKVGLRSTPSVRKAATSVMKDGKQIRSKQGWRLCVSSTDRLCIDRKKHIETTNYNGNVFCATVPNSTLVTRYQGDTLISGNCWMYGTVGAMMLSYAQQGPYLPHLSATSAAAKGKNYRKEGGWAEEALGYIDEYGVSTFDFWPEHSLSNRHDTPEQRGNASLHKVEGRGGWEELAPQSFDDVVSAVLSDWPVTMGLLWWGHLVYALRVVIIERGEFGLEIMNSWHERWENRGKAILRQNKATPHEAIAIKNVTHVQAA